MNTDEHSPTIIVSRFTIVIEYLSEGRISSNIANTIRGGFGATLRSLVCPFSNKSCNDCILASKCAYGYIFETPIPSTTEIMRKYLYAPHPLIIIPPKESSRKVKEKSTTKIEVTLIGKAIDYFPYIFLAFKELGTRGLGADKIKFNIHKVISDNGDLLYSYENDVLRDLTNKQIYIINTGLSKNGIFSIHFITPLRLKVKGRIASLPSFEDIIAALTRRAFLLSYFHCGGNGKPIHTQFLKHAESVEMLDSHIIQLNHDRFSGRQHQKIPMSGFMGTLTFRGNHGLFMPLLKLGEYIHLGKDTIFGYGQIRTEVLS